ncbi:Shedu anti-phage system protein SduA domain-containing protein [Thomasclavelia spiroformis]|uniref:Shedu anti-phage system protein SduA domain-containing protein n=1 Tax=Thomasclavelia spiroformis TaxID=29348 RepID=UPI00399A7DB4
MEKYLYCLNRLNPDSDRFFSILKESLPQNIKPIALNPQGILLLGRSNQFNDQQRNDFELIKRQYKHIADIMTYDDLVIRLENIVNSLKLRLKKIK